MLTALLWRCAQAEFIPRFKEGIPGCIIIHKCTSIRHSISAIKCGADIISLDGFECAGHPGEDDVGNFVLRKHSPIPALD